MTGISPGRAAYEAWWRTAEGVPDSPDVTYEQDSDAWEAAAKAAIAAHKADGTAELARARELIRSLERLTTAWTRGMYAARIDCWRGDPKAAAGTLSEGLDGYDGPEWDGTETGEQWWERTKAEEGL